jgi:ubiquinone/menaquinone biosynthesis C-methylase UbiE
VLVGETYDFSTATQATWISWIYLGLIVGTVTLFIQTWGQKFIESTRTAILFSLEPIFATIFGIAFAEEEMTTQFFFGAFFIMLAIIISSIKFPTKKKIPIERQIGFSEGIDDPAVGIAFNKIQNLPQFNVLRNIVIKHIMHPKLGQPCEAGSTLLDLGCGTGHLLKQIHKSMAKGKLVPMKLYGIDLGAESIRICKEILSNSGITDIDLQQGDGAAMPYADGLFDIVVSSLSLHHWTDPSRVFNEIFRVLRSNGLLILFDMRRDCPRGWHRFLKIITQRIVPKSLRKVNEPLGSLLASYTNAEITAILQKTSWENKKPEFVNVLFGQIVELRK